ncbi:palmitoyl-CoA hydrolase [Dendrobium catenatum]|uniref:Palmitoyl-CoA hydrolase n=1 Tax=Dendrobium catenatum TaxID=906689 RepID=A0A2I0WKX3_9ASPA|nr:palmitoyl-CoA hydrolase [Dendrobium catenatum]
MSCRSWDCELLYLRYGEEGRELKAGSFGHSGEIVGSRSGHYRNDVARRKFVPWPIELRFCASNSARQTKTRSNLVPLVLSFISRLNYWFRARGKLSDDQALHRWIPTEGDSTDPLQDCLYKLQYHLFLCDQKFEKWKRYLKRQFEKEQEEILKKFEDKIKELDAQYSPPQENQKLTHREMSSQEGESDVDKGVCLLEFQEVLFPMPRLLGFHGGLLFSVHGPLVLTVAVGFPSWGGFPVALAPRFRAAPLVPVVAPSVPGLDCFSMKSMGGFPCLCCLDSCVNSMSCPFVFPLSYL